MSKSYHQQFQEDLRTKQRHVPFGKGAAGRPSVPERPTAAVKQASRSNTFTLPKKIEQQSNVKTTKELPKLKGRAPSPAFLPPPPPPPARAPRKELINYHSAAPVRPTLKAIPSMNDQRRPVRFASEVNYAYPSASSAWTNTHHHHHPPPPPPVANRTTRTIHDNNYPNSQHRTTFTDYPSNTVSDYHHSWTSLPPITSQPHFSTIPSGPPTVVIRSKETYPSNPSYHSSAPFMYVPSPPMFVPYSYPYAPPVPPPPPPLPVPVPLPSTSIVNQASSSATSKVDSQPPTIIVPPVQEKQNVTIRLQMADEVCFFDLPVSLLLPLFFFFFFVFVERFSIDFFRFLNLLFTLFVVQHREIMFTLTMTMMIELLLIHRQHK